MLTNKISMEIVNIKKDTRQPEGGKSRYKAMP
jgi:hypothetical protein